ncbi:aprataxin and PNK-like factor isoform X2 [Clupea harengus]|uniref:Aprataxin and PNK-like factor isoform X2 n=1 Tax=Clupea harengus TaxID=7950 RepID=A0A6P8F047_CLUHA|nr:aprataxin and PNK-like factor isoform X2 [Clupea harengus]XP_042559390.1 aprataxin and PNK-like factor isoform X2 [Clupea harengus]
MPNFELKPLDGGSLVHLPEGETVLGRGPLFGVNDKRVSRNHGVLENADGKLRIKPTHVNPCFIQASLEASPQPLKKDQWHTLDPGEMFSLLPGKHIYQVVAVEERGAEEEIEGTLSNSQNLEESDGEVVVPEEANTSWSAPPSANDKPDRSTLPDRGGPSVCQQSTLVASLEGKSLLLPPSSPARDQPPDGEVSERLDGEMSVPARRIRTLPSWMVAASSGDVKSPSTPKGAGKRGPAKAATTPKPKPKPASQVAAAAAAAAPAAAPAASRATPQWARTRVLSSEEEEEVLEEKEEVVQSAKRWRKRTKSADDEEEEEEEA